MTDTTFTAAEVASYNMALKTQMEECIIQTRIRDHIVELHQAAVMELADCHRELLDTQSALAEAKTLLASYNPPAGTSIN